MKVKQFRSISCHARMSHLHFLLDERINLNKIQMNINYVDKMHNYQ